MGPPILAHAHAMIELRRSTGCSDLQTWSLLERAPWCVCAYYGLKIGFSFKQRKEINPNWGWLQTLWGEA